MSQEIPLQTIRTQVSIAANPEKVWRAISHDYYRHKWVQALDPSLFIDGSFERRTLTFFTVTPRDEKFGTIAEVVSYEPGKYVKWRNTATIFIGEVYTTGPYVEGFEGCSIELRLHGEKEPVILECLVIESQNSTGDTAKEWSAALDMIRQVAESL